MTADGFGAGEARIVEVGMCGPLGMNSLQVTTAARAGKLEVREWTPLDKHGHHVGIARARFLPEDLVGIDRLVCLGAPALREAGRSLDQPVPLFVAVADRARPDAGAALETDLVARLSSAAEVAVDPARSGVIRAGNAGFAMALEGAIAELVRGAEAVLVGGVDSYAHPEALAWLDAAHRLHAQGTEDGIVPSEGAAFALLVKANGRGARALPPLAAVRFAGAARDEAALDPEGPVLAETMTTLVQRALVALGAPPTWLFTDLDEMHRVREWSRVELRCHPVFEEAAHDRIPDVFGDVGAATGAIAAAYACRGFALGGAPGGNVIAALAADGAERGVFALTEVR